MALLGAPAAGATRTVVVDPIASKRALALELGATAAVDPSAGDVVASVTEAAGGPGVEYAIEAAGSAAAFTTAIAATAPGGTAVAVGLWRAGRLPVERLVSGTISLDELNPAFDRLANGEAVRTICRL
jgi:Zn-dependent alcohol dehydrogenase